MKIEISNKKLIILLISVAIILSLILSYFFILKPIISKTILNSQAEGIRYAVYSIMSEASQCKEVPLTNPFGNETMNLIWTNCLSKP